MNDEAFPHDPALPQLGVTADAVRMREVFRQHLNTQCGQTCDVQDCKLTRVRYRRGNRSILQYDLRIAESSTARPWTQPVTVSMYAERGRAKRIYEKERGRRAMPRERVGVTLEPFVFVPELELFIQTFPHDRHMPALSRLVTELPADLAVAVLESLGPGAWRIDQQGAETIRYRAGLGATIRYHLVLSNSSTGETRSQCLYLKAYPDDRSAQMFQLLRELRKYMNRTSTQFQIVQPIAYSSGTRAMLLAEAPGVTLEQMLVAGADPALTRGIARALAALNQSEFTCARRHTRADEIANLKRASRRLQWAKPSLRHDLERIVEAVVAGWMELPLAPVHRDLKTDHVFIDAERVVLIDLDSFAMAHPLLDPAQFLARCATLPFRLPVSAECARAAARSFADEYFARVPQIWRERLPIYYAGAVLDATQGFFGRQEPDWPETVAALIRHACDSLDGKVW